MRANPYEARERLIRELFAKAYKSFPKWHHHPAASHLAEATTRHHGLRGAADRRGVQEDAV